MGVPCPLVAAHRRNERQDDNYPPPKPNAHSHQQTTEGCRSQSMREMTAGWSAACTAPLAVLSGSSSKLVSPTRVGSAALLSQTRERSSKSSVGSFAEL